MRVMIFVTKKHYALFNILKGFAIAIFIIGIIFGLIKFIEWACVKNPDNMTARIDLNGEVIVIRVDSYERISSGWMKIVDNDGNIYRVNEKNVLLLEGN